LIGAADPVTYLDVDDTVRATFGYAKQGTGYGYTGVKGLNALLAAGLCRSCYGESSRTCWAG
jgi:hypothetical protein